MAGNFTQYVVAFQYIDLELLVEAQNISIQRETGAVVVATLAKGWAGATPGVSRCRFRVESAAPAAGFEFDAGKKLLTLTKTLFYTLGPGGKTFKGEGIVMGDTFQQGVGQAAQYTFEGEGPLALWT